MEIFTFGKDLGGKLSGYKTRFKKEEIEALGFTFPARTGLQTDTSFYKIIRQLKGYDEKKINIAEENRKFMAEIVVDGKVTQKAVLDLINPNVVKVAEVNEMGAFIPYDETTHGGTIVKALIYCALESYRHKGYSKSMQFVEEISKLSLEDDDFDDDLNKELLMKNLCAITSYIYYSLKEKGTTNVKIEKLRISDEKIFEKAIICYGNPSFVKSAKEGMTTSEKISSSLKVIKGEYILNRERKFSSLEESLIPTMSDTYVCPQEAKTIPRDIQMSNMFNEPYRNVLLVGDSGGGKTTLAKAIASELGLPYANYSCGPDTDSFDTMGGIQPTTEKVKPEELYKKFNIPSFEDVTNDYENTFLKLFGKKPGKLNGPEECYEEISNRLMEASKMCDDFTYVPSNIILGAINGWVVEIQEATIIKRESELVVLNALLENVPGTPITLPNGKVIKRHPDSVFIFTSNMNYKGCKSLQESVLSRINIRREIKTPEVEILANRAEAQCKNTVKEAPKLPKDIIVKMATISKEIDEYCKDHDITDGVCGPRELNDWCKKAIMTSLFWGEAEVSLKTVALCSFAVFIEKISQIPEEVEEVITAVMQKYFTSEDIEEGRLLYENGEI